MFRAHQFILHELSARRIDLSLMKIRIGRTQQMWLLVVACIVLFAIFLTFIPEMTVALWWKAMLCGVGASAISIAIFQVWLSRALMRREGVITLIDRVTSGDLSLTAGEIVAETQ